jgi:hypothetical protein
MTVMTVVTVISRSWRVPPLHRPRESARRPLSALLSGSTEKPRSTRRETVATAMPCLGLQESNDPRVVCRAGRQRKMCRGKGGETPCDTLRRGTPCGSRKRPSQPSHRHPFLHGGSGWFGGLPLHLLAVRKGMFVAYPAAAPRGCHAYFFRLAFRAFAGGVAPLRPR